MKDLPKKLFHYSANPIKNLDKICYDEWPDFGIYGNNASKPKGLWISIEDFSQDTNWRSWCENESYNLESLAYCYEISLKPSAKILYLNNFDEIYEFSINHNGNKSLGFDDVGSSYNYIYVINWKNLKSLYDGIFIAPYDWKARMDIATSWYYGWDCSSGCIWNIDIIDNFILHSEYESYKNIEDIKMDISKIN